MSRLIRNILRLSLPVDGQLLRRALARRICQLVWAQAQEELYHAMRIYNFIHEVGKVVLEAIESPTSSGRARCSFPRRPQARKFIASIHELVQMAEEEKEYAVRDMLQWFIVEQVEEEANFSLHVDQLELGGDTGAALMLMNSKMAARVPLPLSADEQTE